MARQKAVYRKLQKQRRYAVDEIRLREMNRQAHLRAAVIQPHPKANKTSTQIHFERAVRDIVGIAADELPSELNRKRREFLGLEDKSLKTPRDLVMQRVNRMTDNAECVFKVDKRAMYLIRDVRDRRYWYFLYREKGSYYKKSVKYDSRTKAMDRYETEKISWVEIFDDTE